MRARGERLLVALNPGQAPQALRLPEFLPAAARPPRVLLSTAPDRSGEATGAVLGLRPSEGAAVELAAAAPHRATP